MPITPNMGLILPVPEVTEGPTWSEQLNDALELVDSHDHSTGKGSKIAPSGININADLEMNSQDLVEVRSARFENQSAVLAEADDTVCAFVKDGDLYFNNAAGTAVQITNGTSVNASSSATFLEYTDVTIASSPVTIAPSDNYNLYLVSTAAARTINLPAANSINKGKFLIFKDITGSAASNNIIITPDGSDTIEGESGSLTINQAYNSVLLYSDGSSQWFKLDNRKLAALSVTGNLAVGGVISGIGVCPLGAVIPIASNLTGAIAIPSTGTVSADGWQLCDGAAIPGGNTLSGNTPNLSDSRFIMGSTAAGNTGGSATHSHAHTHTLAHTHGTDSKLGTITLAHTHTVASHTHTLSHTHDYRHSHQTAYAGSDKTLYMQSTNSYAQATWTDGGYLVAANNASRASTGAATADIKGAGDALYTSGITSGVNGTTSTADASSTTTSGTAPATDSQLSNYAAAHTHTTDSQSTSTSSSDSTATSTLPTYVTMRYLIRVK
jgi:hypothetical protein